MDIEQIKQKWFQEGQLDILSKLDEVIHKTPVNLNNMEYFILLHKSDIEGKINE